MMDKLIELSQLKSIVAGLKRRDKKVIFANGVFDILHVGHVRYLRDAKSFGDALIVAVNSDVSTRNIKGEGRPYTVEGERVEILSALECVDHIILFDDANVERLLNELRPDVQAKGTDYTEETVPEREIVLAYGGQVMIAGDKKDHSSTEIIEKIKT